MRFFLLLSVLSCFGCSLFRDTHESEWSVLDESKGLECIDWPKAESHLKIKHLYPLGGSKLAGVFADVSLRNDSDAVVYAPMAEGDDIDPDTITTHDLGIGAIVAGGRYLNDKVHAIIVQREKLSSKIEIRSMPDNVVRLDSEAIPEKIIFAQAAVANPGIWLKYKVDSAKAVDDQGFRVLFTGPTTKTKGPKLEVKTFNREFSSDTRLLTIGKGEKALAVWAEQDFRNPKQSKFWIVELKKDGSLAKAQQINIPIKFGVESWSAEAVDGGILFAYIDGDSLVGQSELRVGKVFWEIDYIRVGTLTSKKLVNVHVSEPIWYLDRGRGYLLLPQWTDGESTIARYRFDDQLEQTEMLGVFSKGIRVMSTFQLGSSVKMIVRSRKASAGWDFQLCSL